MVVAGRRFAVAWKEYRHGQGAGYRSRSAFYRLGDH